MDDKTIVELYLDRNEAAITETDKKYGRYCHYIALNILASEQDSEECVNDTYLAAWNAMPPHKPQRLSTFLGKLTRNISLSRYRRDHAEKRVPATELILEEALELIPDGGDTSSDSEAISLALSDFLGTLTKRQRIIFLRRYYYMCGISEIADSLSLSESNVKTILSRIRKNLRAYLEKEGISI